MSKIFFFNFFIILLLHSCATPKTTLAENFESFETEGDQVQSGTVVYNPHGLDQMVKARKNQATARMRKACSPKSFHIEKEALMTINQRFEGTVEDTMAGRVLAFIDFTCR